MKEMIRTERERAAEEAREELLRQAEAQGVAPFTSFEGFTGDADLAADFDIDEFLLMVRDDRDRAGQRSID